MTRRHLLAAETLFFLVQFLEDSKFQVRARNYIKHDDDIEIGKEYEVRWGNAKQLSRATVKGKGRKPEMEKLLEQLVEAALTTPTAATAPTAPTKKGKARNTESHTKITKKRAAIISVGSPPRDQPAIGSDAPTTTRQLEATATIGPDATTPGLRDANATIGPDATTPGLRDANATIGTDATTPGLRDANATTGTDATTPGLRDANATTGTDATTTERNSEHRSLLITPVRRVSTPAETVERNNFIQVFTYLNRMEELMRNQVRALGSLERSIVTVGKRLTAVESRLERLEVSISQKSQQQREPLAPIINEDNPQEPTGGDLVDKVIVAAIHREAHNEAHFACLLMPHVFPELFGPDKLRHLYNWHGVSGKQPLEGSRRQYVEQMTKFFYKEARSATVWTAVVGRINERLRRKEKRTRGEVQITISNENIADYHQF
ncbi:hypothetical protein DPMN_046780 [Dreissena polymorpha]|uniref:BEN domain-containing protein n=1 Tax=Dreissena polymorpha TaxID=45954 RepID=A0A9D4D7H6_DREPO|nr:hypothetical protein DPMN_046780 [Dreissena polymorpha]